MPRTLVLAICVVAVNPCGLAWGQVPISDEFRVNTWTTGDQASPRVATDATGNFVVTWSSYPQDGSSSGAFARRFAADATPLDGTEFVVSTVTIGGQGPPAVAAVPDGRLSFAWTTPDGSGSGVHGRLYDASGTPTTDEFGINAQTSNHQSGPLICADPTGRFVVAWTEFVDALGNETEIVVRQFDPSGVPLGGDLAVNAYTTGRQFAESLACDAAGGFVLAWTYRAALDGDSAGVFGQRFDAAGVRLGAEFQVNEYTTGGQGTVAMASDPVGNFVVVWLSSSQPGSGGVDLFGRRFDAAGAPLGAEFRVNSVTTGDQRLASVGIDPRGNFVVVWNGPGPAQNYEVFGRAFDSAGPISNDFALGTVVAGVRDRPAVALKADGRFVVAWTASDAPGSFGVFARQFVQDVIFRDGFEQGNLSRWSSSALDGGDLGASPSAALDSSAVGLQGNVDDTAAIYVQDDSPDGERRYRARFWLDTNGFDPGTSQGHLRTRGLIAFAEAPSRRVATVVLRKESGVYSLMGRARLDDDAQADTGFFTVSDEPHPVEIDLVVASGPDALDGSLEFFVDGVSRAKLTGLDNSLAAVDFVRMGALSVKAGASGTLYWDEFESRRHSYIGP